MKKTKYFNKVKISDMSYGEIYNIITLNGKIPKDDDDQIELTYKSKMIFSCILYKKKKINDMLESRCFRWNEYNEIYSFFF